MGVTESLHRDAQAQTWPFLVPLGSGAIERLRIRRQSQPAKERPVVAGRNRAPAAEPCVPLGTSCEGPATSREGSEYSTHSTLSITCKRLVLEPQLAGRVTEQCTTSRAFGTATLVPWDPIRREALGLAQSPRVWPHRVGVPSRGAERTASSQGGPGHPGVGGWTGSEARGIRWSCEAGGHVAAAADARLLPRPAGRPVPRGA